MKLYLISQSQNNGYDTHDSAVVAAPDEEIARRISPATGEPIDDWSESSSDWCSSPDHVTALYLGEAVYGIEQGVICASYNAG